MQTITGNSWRTCVRAYFKSAILLASAASGPAMAGPDKQGAPPEVIHSVLECRTIDDAMQRLACFDRNVASLDSAVQNKDVLVMDRATVQQTKQGLFGLDLNKSNIFNDNEDEVKWIDSKLQSARQGKDGRYTLFLEDGSVWVQTDNYFIPDPRKGAAIRVRKASLGSYFARIDDGVSIRVKRENRQN